LSEKRCWDVIVDALRKEGIRFVFGLPGNPVVLYDTRAA